MSVADKKGVGIDLSKCRQPPPSGRLQLLFASGDRLKHSLLIVDNFIHCQPLRFLILLETVMQQYHVLDLSLFIASPQAFWIPVAIVQIILAI